jgi:hypothetical protein
VTVHRDKFDVHVTVHRDKCDVHVTVHRDKFLIIKPIRCTNFSILFWNETLYVSDSSSVHHQESFTVHTAMVYVIPVCGQFASRISMFQTDPACKLSANRYDVYYCIYKLASRIRVEHPDPVCKLSANWYYVYHCCVYSEGLLMMDRGTVRNI